LDHSYTAAERRADRPPALSGSVLFAQTRYLLNANCGCTQMGVLATAGSSVAHEKRASAKKAGLFNRDPLVSASQKAVGGAHPT